MTPIEALNMALEKERNSIKLYKKLIIEHPILKDICEFLVNEEYKHENMIQRKIVELKRM